MPKEKLKLNEITNCSMRYSKNWWRLFWWINDNCPNYVSNSPEEHSELIERMYLLEQKLKLV